MSDVLRIAYGDFGRVALLDMDRSLVRHAHPHCHVLIKVEGADSFFAVGDHLVPLTDAKAVLVNGWESHAYVHIPDRPRTLILALYIEPEWLEVFRTGWQASGSPGFFAQPTGELSPLIRSTSKDLVAEMISRPHARESHEELLAKLMIAVIERFSAWRDHGGSVRGLATPLVDFRIRRAIQAMREDHSEGDDMNRLAKKVGLSRAHFFRLFEANTHVSPRVYLNVIRVEAAVDASANSDESFSIIGERLGFSAPTHFNRFFRDHLGVPPGEFRRVIKASSAV
ncbi:AraC family transcriptional regulator [Brucella sp. 10RB9213]|uniref:helix-turn-helix transcriptional regulator n=1 Tax=Brucella sp. 10RB9213 TaxID=1844039 RepID=UPI0012ADA3BE|nr:AraC family transcriptional regulator [Brucella sp. 10RB9213]MRN67554.1 helix-turn-helix domain-containing protein [Brucella sp. 10RB9213]